MSSNDTLGYLGYASCASAKQSINMRLFGRFLFLHTQKLTQKHPLDSRSRPTHQYCRLLALHGSVALSHTCLFSAAPHPLSISAIRHTTVPPTPANRRLRCLTYALYFAQTMLLGLDDLKVKSYPLPFLMWWYTRCVFEQLIRFHY